MLEKDIETTLQKLIIKYDTPHDYVYSFPSPNDGKRLIIQGPIGPSVAAKIVHKIWKNEAKIQDFPYLIEEKI